MGIKIGEEYDSETEFSYLNARYYQGSRGRFMSQDPVCKLRCGPVGRKCYLLIRSCKTHIAMREVIR
jgi:hypothetical protein